MKKIFTPLLCGFITPNFFGFVLISLTGYLLRGRTGNFGVLVFSEFVIVPMLMGIISAWHWRNLGLLSKHAVYYSLVNCCLALLLSCIFLNEGYICLIIVSPLIFLFMITGVFIGRAMFKNDNSTLNASIIALLLFVFIADSLSTHYYENEVSDQLVINATPEKIWKNVVAFRRIKTENKFWLFRIGMPSPVESTVEGYHLGAKRKCIFSNGYVFDEKIVAYDQGKDLTFDIVNQPRDPEIMGHIDIQRGQFLLKDNGDGTTTLTGNSWYRLYVFPVWYYDTWAKSITRNVHWRVMEHIKELSEAK